MHLTDSAVHQELFLDVLNGTRVLVGVAFYQFFHFLIVIFALFLQMLVVIEVFRFCEKELKQSLSPLMSCLNLYFVCVILVIIK